MKLHPLPSILPLLTICLLLASCLRYTPSRQEIANNNDNQNAAEYAGEEAFFGIDKEQRARLEALALKRLTAQRQNQDPSYRIGIGDVLELTVFDIDELNGKFRVRPSGHISLPLVGTLAVKGLSESEVQEQISKSLDSYVYNPQVHVFISDYAAHKVWVIGAVQKPGAYPLTRDNYNLLELLSEAGGRTERASSLIYLIPGPTALTHYTRSPKVSVPKVKQNLAAVRKNGIEIYFDDLVGSIDRAPLEIPLLAGDSIVVPEAGRVQIDGEVNKPGSYQLASKMTLLGAIASAEGLTYSADVHNVEVIRELGSGKKALITVDLEQLAIQEGNDIRIRDSDVVRVPSEPGRFATRQTINIFNGIFGRFMPF